MRQLKVLDMCQSFFVLEEIEFVAESRRLVWKSFSSLQA